MDKAKQIFTLIQPFVKEGKILPRTIEQINHNIDDFILLYEKDRLTACAGLKDCKEGLVGEIYSLAVAQNSQNTGLSNELLHKILINAKQRKFGKIFALTKFGTDWFVKNGFIQMKISDLPAKRQRYFNHDRNSSIFFKEIV